MIDVDNLTAIEMSKLVLKIGNKMNHPTLVNIGLGELGESLAAAAFDGKVANFNQKGFDIKSREFGNIEVKVCGAHSKVKRQTLTNNKREMCDSVLYVQMGPSDTIECAYLFTKEQHAPLWANSGLLINESRGKQYGTDVTALLQNLAN